METHVGPAAAVTEVAPMRAISNSEVGSWLSCRRKYHYAFDLSVEPQCYSEPLSKGILGHAVLETYYLTRLEGASHDTAALEALRLISAEMVGGAYEIEWLIDLKRIIERYFAYCVNDQWEILHVEKSFEIPVSSEFSYRMKLDLCVRDLVSGQVLLIDHKFVYDFWSQEDLDLSVQMPKYFGTLKFNGVKVDKVMINMLRYRILKRPMEDVELFRRITYTPRDAIVREHLREQLAASDEIIHYWTLDPESRKTAAIRNMNKFNCRGCPVKSLCLAELHGGETQLLLQTQYQQNAYNERAKNELFVP